MINKSLVADLDDDILALALQVFLKNASIEVPQLIQAFEKKNLPEVKRLAHKLKGSSIAVGLEDFSNHCRYIEDAIMEQQDLNSKSIAKLETLFQEIKTQYS